MKKTISIIMIMAMVIGITLPMTPVFAVTYETDQGYYNPEQLPGNLGITRDAMVDLKEIMKKYLLWRGNDSKSAGVDYFWNNVLTTEVKNDLGDHGVTKENLEDAFDTLYGEVTVNQTVEEIANGLKTLADDFSTIYNNINDQYILESTSTEYSKVATYLYYAVDTMQENNILQPDGSTINFVFSETSGLSDNMTSRNNEFTIKEYIELGMSDGNELTVNLVTLESELNDELHEFITSTDVTATEIEELAIAFNVLLPEETPPETPDDGGTSGGGGGGSSTPPADDSDDESDEPEETTLDETIDEGISETVKIFEDENATGEEIAESINKLSAEASNFLDDEDVDGESAAAIVKQIVEKTITQALASEKTSQKEKDQLEKTARALVDKAVKKAGTVNITAETEITNDLVKDAISKAKTAVISLEETLTTAGLGNVNRPLKTTVTLKSEDDDSNISLSEDIIASLKGENANLSIGNNDSSILVPSDTLENIAAGESIEISTKAVSQGLNDGLNNIAGEKYKFVKTRDIVVSKTKADGSSEQLTKLSLSFDLSDYEGDTDQVAVLVRNDETGAFELLNSWVVDGALQFKSPHYSYYTLADYTPGFDDITGHWGQKVINKMAAKGIVKGRSDEIFDPQGSITRAEFITMLMNAFDYEAEVVTSFDDTTANDWFYIPVNVGKALGLVNGVGQNEFNPNASITRQDMVVMMARFFKEETGEALFAVGDAFDDSEASSNYARAYINGAAEVDIVSGDGEGFKPLNNATRTEALKMIDNLLIYLK